MFTACALAPSRRTRVDSGPETSHPQPQGAEEPPPVEPERTLEEAISTVYQSPEKKGLGPRTYCPAPFFWKEGAREERDLPTEDDTQHPTGSEDHPAPSSQYSTTPVVPGPPAWPPVYSTRYASPASPTGSVSLPQPSHSKTFPSPGWVVL